MSAKTVDVVRRWIEAYNRRDFPGLIELTDPDFEFRSIFVAIESVFRGYDGFPHAYFRQLEEAYERFEVVPERFIDAGAAVLVIASAEWRGRGSGAEGSLAISVASWLRAGRLFRVETFTERQQALEAVGLE